MNERRSRPRRCTHSAEPTQTPASAASGAVASVTSRLRRARQLLVDDFLELLEGLRARQHTAVDEERRRPADAHARAVGDVLVDYRLELLLREAVVELLLIHADLARHRLQLLRAQVGRSPE